MFLVKYGELAKSPTSSQDGFVEMQQITKPTWLERS